MMSKSHHFFLLNWSPWPLISSLNGFGLLFSFSLFLKFNEEKVFSLSLLNLMFCCFFWWMFYAGEFNLEGHDSTILESGLKFSMLLFITSEIFFFFSFFWSYFHYYLAPTLEIGFMWPPYSIEMFDFLNVPLINTLLLVTSGVSVTASHHFLLKGSFKMFNFYLILTIFLGILFSLLQGMEYASSFFSIGDSSFGTSFFILTGFHGIHVLVGTIFLLVSLSSSMELKPSQKYCTMFELSSWYWHFVDVVWIFLYFTLYYLNN